MRRRQLPGEPPPPSKSDLKREAQNVQELADRLVGAPADVIARLQLPEKVADALALARRITSHGARLRQQQYVGKLLRTLELAPIRAALDASAESARRAAARFRRAERWRDRLVQEGAAAVAEFVAGHPAADARELRRLVTAASADRGRGGGPAGRELFRYVQAQLSPSGDVSALNG